ncbi:RraA family protein [Bacillus sp. JJ1532]|uniref:RraA family protein n=1 Tax=Bacillus sp. JJ1532 TaxID=3122958 RepID=UPI002FFEC9BD
MSQTVKRPSKELIEGFKELSTCNVSDALDKLGLSSGVHGIRPLFDCEKIVGPAITMKIIPHGPEVPKGHLGADALDIAEPGDIIVIDNSGRTDQNCWGEILAFAAQQQGVSGVIIDGAARDIDIISEIKFPVYARGNVPFTARGRNVQGGFNCTVQVGGVQVRPVDIIMADINGVVVIPIENAEEVLHVSKELFDREAEIVRLLKSGIPFSEVDRQSGYDRMLEKKS